MSEPAVKAKAEAAKDRSNLLLSGADRNQLEEFTVEGNH